VVSRPSLDLRHNKTIFYKISTSCLVRPLRCPLQDIFLTSIEGVSRHQLCDREPSCVRVPVASLGLFVPVRVVGLVKGKVGAWW